MTLIEFINKYINTKVDFDGVYGAQCVDLARQYWKEGLGIPEHTGACLTTGGAKDLYLDYDKMPLEKKYFKKIPASKKILIGDTAIWNSTETNKYGHVAIVLGELSDSLIVFEQDGFKQDGAKLNIRSKKNMLGVLRFKNVDKTE
mgnify:CR=1 FL=1